MITSHNGIADLGTVLGVWAHPDDEAYLSGGVMALARDAGSRVVCVTATRGERGTSDPVAWPPDRLAEQRTAELARCLALLGVTEHHWLDYPDGECPRIPDGEAVERLSTVIDRVRPDTVLTFGPDGITGHPDHRTVSTWTTAAFQRAAPSGARLLYAAFSERRVSRWGRLDGELGVHFPGYPVPVPDDHLALHVELDPHTVSRKVSALLAQQTQTAGLIATMGLDRYTAWVGEESYRDAGAHRR